jgi:hypothetical protein
MQGLTAFSENANEAKVNFKKMRDMLMQVQPLMRPTNFRVSATIRSPMYALL